MALTGLNSKDEKETRKICESIAPLTNTLFGDFWTFGLDVVEEDIHNRQDTAYTNKGIGPHTDGTYFVHPPGIQVY